MKILNIITVSVLVAAAVSCISPSVPREARDLDEVMDLLLQANTVSFRDVGRNESGLGTIEYPYLVKGSDAVQRLANLIEKSRFQFDARETEFFRDGGAVDANVFLEVLIDGKVSFMIFTGNCIKTADFTMYTAQQYDPMKEELFAEDLNHLLKEVGIKQPQQPPERDK